VITRTRLTKPDFRHDPPTPPGGAPPAAPPRHRAIAPRPRRARPPRARPPRPGQIQTSMPGYLSALIKWPSMTVHHYQVGYQLRRAEHVMALVFEAKLRPLEITTSQAVVLLAIDRNPDATIAHLAKSVAITPRTLQRIIAGLERRGLIERKSRLDDERSFFFSLTPPGAQLVRRAEAVLKAEQDVIKEHFDAQELETLHTLLRRFEAIFQTGQDG
jgi:DNA-binding MarR family transcriptional regulator